MPNQKLLTFVNLYQLAKNNPAVRLPEGIAEERGTRFFPNIGFVQNKANNINFHFRINSVKINDQFFL